MQIQGVFLFKLGTFETVVKVNPLITPFFWLTALLLSGCLRRLIILIFNYQSAHISISDQSAKLTFRTSLSWICIYTKITLSRPARFLVAQFKQCNAALSIIFYMLGSETVTQISHDIIHYVWFCVCDEPTLISAENALKMGDCSHLSRCYHLAQLFYV